MDVPSGRWGLWLSRLSVFLGQTLKHKNAHSWKLCRFWLKWRHLSWRLKCLTLLSFCGVSVGNASLYLLVSFVLWGKLALHLPILLCQFWSSFMVDVVIWEQHFGLSKSIRNVLTFAWMHKFIPAWCLHVYGMEWWPPNGFRSVQDHATRWLLSRWQDPWNTPKRLLEASRCAKGSWGDDRSVGTWNFHHSGDAWDGCADGWPCFPTHWDAEENGKFGVIQGGPKLPTTWIKEVTWPSFKLQLEQQIDAIASTIQFRCFEYKHVYIYI